MSDSDPAFSHGEWVVDKQDPDNEPALVVNPDAGRADEVTVGTTNRTVAEFVTNKPYSASDRVVTVVFRSELEAQGVDIGEAVAEPMVISVHEDKWGVSVRRYDYPEPRLAPRIDTPEGESG